MWLAVVSVSTDDCGYIFTTKTAMVSLDCSHIMICGIAAKMYLPVKQILLLGTPTLKCCSQMDFKGTHNDGKDRNRKEPWAESSDFKRPFIEKSIPRT